MDRRIVLQLVGATIREVGTLAVLFGPLEWVMSQRAFDIRVLIGWIVVSLIMIVGGIILEARNRWIQ